MRGRFTFGLLLAAAMVVGCAGNKQTAEQKREEQARREQEKLEKQELREQERAEKKRAGQRRWELGQHMFFHEDEPRLADAHAQRAAANGAVEDADFSEQHFDGVELNSLGRSKLDLLLSAAPIGAPLTVYVGGDPAKAKDRLASLEKNRKASKYPDVQLVSKEGRNPVQMTPAVAGLRGLQKLEAKKAADRTVDINVSGSGQTGVPNTTP